MAGSCSGCWCGGCWLGVLSAVGWFGGCLLLWCGLVVVWFVGLVVASICWVSFCWVVVVVVAGFCPLLVGLHLVGGCCWFLSSVGWVVLGCVCVWLLVFVFCWLGWTWFGVVAGCCLLLVGLCLVVWGWVGLGLGLLLEFVICWLGWAWLSEP